MTRILLRALAAAAAVALAACAPGTTARTGSDPADQRVVRVAAAADLAYALDEIADLAATEVPPITLQIAYGSSGMFVQQIVNGAPFDLYLSADVAYPHLLVDEGLATADDVFPYAVGRLVLWLPEGSPVDPSDGLQALLDPRVRKVAIANPEHAPYGRAAVAALRTAGVYDAVQDKLVLGENVAQAAEFVRAGSAQAGVVAMSLVRSDPLREVGLWVEVPPESFPRLDQGGVVLASAHDPDAARAARDVILGPAGTAILEAYGFILPEG